MKLLTSLPVPLRVLLIALVTVLPHGINLLSRIFIRPFWPRQHIRNRHAAFHWWGRNLARACGMRVKVEGTPPKGAFFLVCNHVSYLDIPLLGIFLDAVFIGKADLRTWPVLGWMIETTDAVFIDRTRRKDLLRAMSTIDAFRQNGYGVVLFPEGTSTRGDQILPLKPSLLEYPATHHLPVHWATVSYRTPDGSPPPSNSVCWWGDELLAPHVGRMLKLPGFEATVRFGAKSIHETDRKVLAKRLHGAMEEAFLPME